MTKQQKIELERLTFMVAHGYFILRVSAGYTFAKKGWLSPDTFTSMHDTKLACCEHIEEELTVAWMEERHEVDFIA